jgi:hypothetical protein
MVKKILSLIPLVLILALLPALSGTARARGPGGHPGMSLTPEQFAAMQEIHAEFSKRIQPLQQDLYAKQAELDAFRFKGTPYEDPAVQKLIREIDDLDTQLYAAHKELRARMNAGGIPYYGHGMGPGYGGWHRGPGYGRYGGPGPCGFGPGGCL